mmetsp:Transcript_13061/g.42794  ORF Transcript_13061/g.42794 Transcript_13061/m.42794 type:complete len:227 (-) Transcript_13061:969-1649(-)|eukprot:scaffold27145_cov118-Isochrysis_galbana.AAC.2
MRKSPVRGWRSRCGTPPPSSVTINERRHTWPRRVRSDGPALSLSEMSLSEWGSDLLDASPTSASLCRQLEPRVVLVHQVLPRDGQARLDGALRADAHHHGHRAVLQAHLWHRPGNEAGVRKALELVKSGARVIARPHQLGVDAHVLLQPRAAFVNRRGSRAVLIRAGVVGRPHVTAEVDLLSAGGQWEPAGERARSAQEGCALGRLQQEGAGRIAGRRRPRAGCRY